MPIYEYECDLCSCRFESKQRFFDEPVATCPECQGRARRVLRASPVIFKSKGFYTTDSRKSNPEDKGKEKATSQEKHDGD